MNKKDIIIVFLALFSFFSCKKETNLRQQDILRENNLHSFQLKGYLGNLETIDVQAIGHKMQQDNFRASLYFNGLNAIATTQFSLEDFQEGANPRVNARWGLIHQSPDEELFEGRNCKQAIAQAPNSTPKVNTVLFKANKANSIEGASLQMYCQTTWNLFDIKSAWMCLGGKEGIGNDGVTKQYFDAEHSTDPNNRIEVLKSPNTFQRGRHIPVMTDVEPFQNFSDRTAKFAPRGTLIGLCLDNQTDKDLIITGIVVPKNNVFSFSGYFDWSNGVKPQFVSTDKFNDGDKRIFKVYSGQSLGYKLRKEHTDTPCLYIWGFPKGGNHQTFDLQLRYQTSEGGKEYYTKTIKISPPQSANNNETNSFKDGSAYTKLIHIKDLYELKLSANAVVVGTPTSPVSNTASINITSGTGAYTIKTNNSKKAVASLAGNTITIRGKGVYNAVVTVIDNETMMSQEISVSIKPKDYGTPTGVQRIANLSTVMKETSGLIYWNGHLITHNDSGGKNQLYCFNKNNGKLIRTITLQGAKNRDWEDIAQDDDYIYVGDIGNNVGTLTSFKIYKVSKQAILAKGSGNITVPLAETLNFPKLDGANAGGGNMNHDWDMEALILKEGKLSIFTKQWRTQTQTKRFEYNGNKMVQQEVLNVNPKFAVTGADYDEANNVLFLIGYYAIRLFGYSLPEDARIMMIKDWGKSNQSVLSLDLGLKKDGYAYQVEGICVDDRGNVYITNENLKISGFFGTNNPASLHRIKF